MTDLGAPLQTREDLSRLAFVLDGLASALSVGWEIEEASLDELLAQLRAPDPAGHAREELAHLARVASYEEGESGDEGYSEWVIDNKKLKQADGARARLVTAPRLLSPSARKGDAT